MLGKASSGRECRVSLGIPVRCPNKSAQQYRDIHRAPVSGMLLPNIASCREESQRTVLERSHQCRQTDIHGSRAGFLLSEAAIVWCPDVPSRPDTVCCNVALPFSNVLPVLVRPLLIVSNHTGSYEIMHWRFCAR